MLTVVKITKAEELPSIRTPWNELLERSDNSAPYLYYEWFEGSYECIDKNKGPFILLVKDNHDLIGVAPFLISTDRYYGTKINKIHFINSDYTPFQDFILNRTRKKECLQAIVRFLCDNFHLWDLLELKEVRNHSEHMIIFKNLCQQNGLFFEQTPELSSGFLVTDISWEEGLSKLNPKTRKEFRRKLSRMEQLGSLDLECVTEPHDIDDHLNRFFNFWNKVWKDKNSISSHSEFYFKIAHNFAERGELYLYSLLLDDEPVAYLYSIKLKNTFFAIKTTYNPSYYAFSPGVILFYKIIQIIYQDESISFFDFGRGDNQYKNDWKLTYVDQSSIYLSHKKCLYGFVRYKALPFFKRRKKIESLIEGLKTSQKYLESFNIKSKLQYLIKPFSCRNVGNKKSLPNDMILYKNFAKIESEKKLDGLMQVSYRVATIEDIDQLAVVTAAKNFKDIINKIEGKDICFIGLAVRKIYFFAWLTPFRNCSLEIIKKIEMKEHDIFLSDFGPIDLSVSENQKIIIQKGLEMINTLHYKSIFTRSKIEEHEKLTILKSIGFKEYYSTRQAIN
ncbi:MAG: GNAT family N-acetyltransferase [Pseudomonadota bacterium]